MTKHTIASLGHTLNVPITAEGVESESIRTALAQYGCSEAQGWLFGRAPMRSLEPWTQPPLMPPPASRRL